MAREENCRESEAPCWEKNRHEEVPHCHPVRPWVAVHHFERPVCRDINFSWEKFVGTVPLPTGFLFHDHLHVHDSLGPSFYGFRGYRRHWNDAFF